MTAHSEREALIEAIELIGSVAEFAAGLSCSPAAVYKWVDKGLPPGRAMAIEQLTAKRVVRERLFGGIDLWLSRQAARRKRGGATGQRARPKRY